MTSSQSIVRASPPKEVGYQTQRIRRADHSRSHHRYTHNTQELLLAQRVKFHDVFIYRSSVPPHLFNKLAKGKERWPCSFPKQSLSQSRFPVTRKMFKMSDHKRGRRPWKPRPLQSDHAKGQEQQLLHRLLEHHASKRCKTQAHICKVHYSSTPWKSSA